MREYGQHSACPRRCAAARDRHPAGLGCEPGSARPEPAGRKCGALPGSRRGRDPGFEAKRLILLDPDCGEDPAKAAARLRVLLDRVKTLPQLSDAALGGVPMTGTWTPPIIAGTLRGRTLASYATETYFDTLGIP